MLERRENRISMFIPTNITDSLKGTFSGGVMSRKKTVIHFFMLLFRNLKKKRNVCYCIKWSIMLFHSVSRWKTEKKNWLNNSFLFTFVYFEIWQVLLTFHIFLNVKKQKKKKKSFWWVSFFFSIFFREENSGNSEGM